MKELQSWKWNVAWIENILLTYSKLEDMELRG